ncbi:MAG: type I DNA topoisomerase, partial [Clostridia bacterium]|nr:type I DNA topoisomerase [Clostridia bacterium]
MSKLVIVESPAKAKTIKKYLGSGYEVVASNGHVRDLPKSKIGIDVDHGFKPQYVNIDSKGDLIKKLKQKASESESVYLATDPDREGEAISWHLAQMLALDVDSENRVTFNEITKTGVTDGMTAPRKIDIDLVDAQQARRVLDRLVGYKLSPFLWKKVRRGLSAGRVQSVAVKIIVDREREIRAFVPEEYWTIDAKLCKKGDTKAFDSKFYGTATEKIDIHNEQEANEIFDAVKDAEFTVASIKKGVRTRKPAPPFITSTMQQEASRKLGFTAQRTMRAAQTLYEGVDVNELGTTGLITYMRTD